MKRLDMHGCKHAHFDGQSAKTNVAALIDEHAKAWEQQHKRQAMTS